MALFNQSTKAVSAVIVEIADAVGASADTEMKARSFNALLATVGYFNTRANWEFMLTQADPISIIAPFAVTGVTASAGQTSALAPASHGFLVDDLITMAGVVLGTRVSATAAGSIGLSTQISASIGTGNVVTTATATRDMYALPSAWKAPYGASLLAAQRTIRFYRSRFYNRSTTQPYAASTPAGYDIFPVPAKGKLKLRQPPNQPDILILDYYRRITPPSAVADATLFDVPQDYEPFLIAYAKALFIVDKGEGRKEQGETWMSFAKEGIATMLADQVRVPDEDLGFTPGHFSYIPGDNPNATTQIQWDR